MGASVSEQQSRKQPLRNPADNRFAPPSLAGFAAVLKVMQKCYTMQMPTTKRRINITIDDATYAAIERLADDRQESISRASLRLIEEALEYQEDRYFSTAGDARLRKKQRRVSHDAAWD
jgi:hypothetical protein